MSRNLPIAVEGLPFAVPLLILSIGLWIAGARKTAVVFAVMTIFVVWFFRNPERETPSDPMAVVSPADGRIIIAEVVNEERYLKDKVFKISIFMNVFNVHVNRVPFSGTVEGVYYNTGRFISANLDKASLDNEQNAVVLNVRDNRRVMFVQIAGLIARRIVCYLKPGDVVTKGERMGLIRFGSRLDVYLPVDSAVKVKLGDKVVAGRSIIGYLK